MAKKRCLDANEVFVSEEELSEHLAEYEGEED